MESKLAPEGAPVFWEGWSATTLGVSRAASAAMDPAGRCVDVAANWVRELPVVAESKA